MEQKVMTDTSAAANLNRAFKPLQIGLAVSVLFFVGYIALGWN
jgi:hypothetical protein